MNSTRPQVSPFIAKNIAPKTVTRSVINFNFGTPRWERDSSTKVQYQSHTFYVFETDIGKGKLQDSRVLKENPLELQFFEKHRTAFVVAEIFGTLVLTGLFAASIMYFDDVDSMLAPIGAVFLPIGIFGAITGTVMHVVYATKAINKKAEIKKYIENELERINSDDELVGHIYSNLQNAFGNEEVATKAILKRILLARGYSKDSAKGLYQKKVIAKLMIDTIDQDALAWYSKSMEGVQGVIIRSGGFCSPITNFDS